jgi:hypothetical protein
MWLRKANLLAPLQSAQLILQPTMQRILFRKRLDSQFHDALISLQKAFEEEAARQERERLDYARLVGLQEREHVLQTCPISWPATMAERMTAQSDESESVGPTRVKGEI